MDVRADQVLVGQVQAGRGDRSADHIGRAPEVVLVVGVAGRAVGDHQRGLPGASGAAGPLRVVGRRRRHVAQPDGAQRVDVHPEFHGRRAVQDRQRGLAELALAFLPFGGRDLGGVLLGAQPGQGRGDAPVQLAEERVDPRAFLVVQGPPHPVFRTGQPAPGLPVDHRRAQPVTRNVVLVGRHGHRQQPGLVQRAEQVGDDLLGVGGLQGDLAGWRTRGSGTGRTGRGRTGTRCCAAGRACRARGRPRPPAAGARARAATTAPSGAARTAAGPGRTRRR